MQRVLIPTDIDDLLQVGFIEAYRSLGWDVVVGTANLRIHACDYDVIHHQWPEEYCGWVVPSEERIAEIEQNLQWWSSRATNIFTVHNLYPHYGVGDPACHELYSCFYRHCHLISHFSHTSLRLVLEEFPAARQARHVVHCPPNLALVLARQKQRGSRRAEMEIDDDEFVILVIGSIRNRAEIELIERAFDLARVPKKRLLMAGKLALNDPSWKRRLLQLRLHWWLKRRGAAVDTRYVPENEISRFFDSCDVAIVPRSGGLNSAIVFYAMTFGRMVIAPRCGAYPEQLEGSRNLLFEPGDAASLASKLEEAATLDTDDIGRENGIIASKWSWHEICRMCLAAASEQSNPPHRGSQAPLANESNSNHGELARLTTLPDAGHSKRGL